MLVNELLEIELVDILVVKVKPKVVVEFVTKGKPELVNRLEVVGDDTNELSLGVVGETVELRLDDGTELLGVHSVDVEVVLDKEGELPGDTTGAGATVPVPDGELADGLEDDSESDGEETPVGRPVYGLVAGRVDGAEIVTKVDVGYEDGYGLYPDPEDKVGYTVSGGGYKVG